MGVPEDATMIVEVELLSIEEKTGRFWNMDANSDEKITFDEFKEYFQMMVTWSFILHFVHSRK